MLLTRHCCIKTPSPSRDLLISSSNNDMTLFNNGHLLYNGSPSSSPNRSQISIGSSTRKLENKHLRRARSGLRKVFGKSKTSLASSSDEHTPGAIHGEVDALQHELMVKDERVKVLLEENEQHWMEIADMSRKVEERNNDVLFLKREMEDERRMVESTVKDKEAIGLKLVEVMERVQALELELQGEGTVKDDVRRETKVDRSFDAPVTKESPPDTPARIKDQGVARLHKKLRRAPFFFPLVGLGLVLLVLYMLRNQSKLESCRPPPTKTCDTPSCRTAG